MNPSELAHSLMGVLMQRKHYITYDRFELEHDGKRGDCVLKQVEDDIAEWFFNQSNPKIKPYNEESGK